jgi:hypothetical protein
MQLRGVYGVHIAEQRKQATRRGAAIFVGTYPQLRTLFWAAKKPRKGIAKRRMRQN